MRKSLAVAAALLLLLSGCAMSKPSGKSITVSLRVDCTAAVEYGIRNEASFEKIIPQDGIMLECEVEVQEGASMLDAVKAAFAEQKIVYVESGGYISSIGGLAQTACGAMSGWLTKLNGEFPSVSAAETAISDGDKIELIYVTSFEEF